jgi:uncharacterized protein with beta-barrel porin domain
VTSTVAGAVLRLGIALFVAIVLLSIVPARPAQADCLQSGNNVDCSGASPGGFNAGAQDGLTVTVQPGATVGTGLTLNNNNVISNLGAISVGNSAFGIAAGSNNQITSSGTIIAGNAATGITLAGTGWVVNSGSITAGTTGIGISGPSVTNTAAGTITVDDSGVGISATTGFGALVNNGSIVTGVGGTGIQNTNNVNNLTIFNTGSIVFIGSGVGVGIDASGGSGHTITNSGSIVDIGTCGCGGAGIQTGDASTVVNSGSISVGAFGGGIIGASGMTVINIGAITTGNDGIGIYTNGDSNIVNFGTIAVGNTVSDGAGMVGDGSRVQLTNAGTITGGRGVTGMVATGPDSGLINTGAITVGRFGIGMWGMDENSNLVNYGTITAGRDGFGMLGSGSSNIVNRGTITVGRDGGGLVGQGTGNQLVNVGSIIVGEAAVGMAAQGNGNALINVGTITGIDFAGGMSGQGNNNVFVNVGTIDVGADGVGIISTGNNAIATNAGTINVGACGVGIDTSFGSGSRVTNTGSIVGTGCSATGVSLGDGDSLTNSGLISAPFSVSTFFAGNATVLNTGTLDGALNLSGSGGNTLINSGLITVSTPLVPGGGVAHVVDGTFTQTGSGVFAIRIMPGNAAGNYDTLRVAGSVPGTGVANLGGTLRPVAQPGLYGSRTTHSGVLTFASSTGRFASVAAPSIFLNASAVYNPTSVDLVLTRTPFNQLPGGGANGRAVGNVLEANYSTGLTGTLASFYAQLLLSTAPNTLSQLTGEIATAPQNAAYTVFGQFLGTMFGQTGSARALGGSSGRAALPNPSQTAQRTTTSGGGTRVALSPAEPCLGDACDSGAAQRYTFWAQGFGGSSSIDGNANIGNSRVDMTSGGGATGIDAWLTPNALVGFTMGTTSAGYNLSDLLSSGGARSIVFGLYGGYTQGPAYVDAALAYAYNTFTSSRFIGTGTLSEIASASFDGSQYGGRVEGGWRFAFDRNVLTPFAGLTVQALTQSGYTETSRTAATGAPGMLGVAVQGQTTTSVRSTLGGQFETAIKASDDNVVRPRLRLGWAHEFNTNRSATVTLSSLLPGAPFQVMGAQPAPDALLVGAGLDIELGRMVRLYGQFDGEFSSNARGFSGIGGVRLIW